MDLDTTLKYADTLKPNEAKVYYAILSLLEPSYKPDNINTVEIDLSAVQEATGMSTATIKRHIKTIHSKGLLPNVRIVEYNAKYLYDLFCDIYRSTYNQDYKARSIVADLTQLKRVVNAMPKDKAVHLITSTVLRYRTKYANTNYPLPTVGILCSWAISKTEQAEKRQNARNLPTAMPGSTVITVTRGAELDLDFI